MRYFIGALMYDILTMISAFFLFLYYFSCILIRRIMIEIKEMRYIRDQMRLAAHKVIEKSIDPDLRLKIWESLENGASPVVIAKSIPTSEDKQRKILLHCEYLRDKYFKTEKATHEIQK